MSAHLIVFTKQISDFAQKHMNSFVGAAILEIS